MFAVDAHFVAFGVDRDFGRAVVVNQVFFADIAAVVDCQGLLLQAVLAADVGVDGGLGDEQYRCFAHGFAVRAEHGAVDDGLRGGDAGVGVAHARVADAAVFDDDLGFYAEKGRFPEHNIGHFARFDGADVLADAVGDGGVDGVFGDVALDAEIVEAV